MKNKITLRMIFLMLVFGLAIVLSQTYNTREEGVKNGLKKADAIAEVVKSGLTAHMINGNMHQRDVFLKSIAQTKNIDKIWIIRGENVLKQFGHPSDIVAPKDAIDEKVLQTGISQYELIETLSKAQLRVTIPYKATDGGDINCISCHKVKTNDTLGAVSIIVDVTDFKDNGIKNSIIIIFITLLAVILAIFFINKLINPYIETLEIIKNRIDFASNGVFKNITTLKNKNTPIETKELIDKYNLLTDSLMNTFTDIDNKLKIFVGQTVDINGQQYNPLEEANHIINNLSYIYQFKKEIQLDKSKIEIYKRLCDIFKNQFDLHNVNIVEISNNTTAEKIYQIGDLDFCTKIILDDPKECRVSRNANHVSSIDFQKACPCFSNEEYLYFCIDVEIGQNSKIIFNFILKDKSAMNEFKKNQLFIESYIKEVAPEIEVKRLLKALEDSALKDGLTGLYNRRFLDEHLKKLIPQAKREEMNIGFLMLDMDHFKAVNDEYGHDIGDKVLVAFADTVQENIRDSDIAVRFGGEEFLVLLIGIKNEQDAIDVANKIREKVAQNEIDVYAGSTMRKTISIGISMFPMDSTSVVKVMKFADLALYEAKNSGRNQVKRYEENPTDTLELF